MSKTKMTKKRRRAACIVEIIDTHGVTNILIASQKGDEYDMIPGGGVDRGEPPIVSAIRELNEETALRTEAIMKLFDYESKFTEHLVFLIKTEGVDFEPRDDVEALWLLPLSACRDLSNQHKLSRSTKHIIARYMSWRDQSPHLFPPPH